MTARETRVSRVDKARERMESTLTALAIDGYRAELIRQSAENLATERVRESSLAELAALVAKRSKPGAQ